jgi:hypothetical protein
MFILFCGAVFLLVLALVVVWNAIGDFHTYIKECRAEHKELKE